MNGYATTFPTNRIVVYAHPASDEESLRNYMDWNELVVSHELTHIFHLDRARGVWGLGQRIFGRNPLLFPNIYEPSWVTEGLAVYFESRNTGVGRLESGNQLMIARASALGHELPRLDALSSGTSRYPGGEVVYIYGSLLFDYLSRTTDPRDIRKFVERSSASLVPFFINRNAKSAFGMTFETAWRHWRDSLFAGLPAMSEPAGWRELTTAGRTAFYPRWVSDSVIYYSASNGRNVPALYALNLSGREKNLGRRNGVDPNVRVADGTVLFTQQDLVSPYENRADLWRQRGSEQTRLTRGARLHSIDASPAGDVVAVQNLPASTRLVHVSADGKRISPLTAGTLDVQWSDPRWSPDGTRIAAIRLARGRSEIVILDSSGSEIESLAAARAINSTPAWSRDGRFIFFTSERSGSSQLYVVALDHPSEVRRLTSVATGIFQPDVSPDGRYITAALYRGDGYHIGVFPLPDFSALPIADTVNVSPRAGCADCVRYSTGEPSASTAPIKPYSALPGLLPRYWLPILQSSSDNGSGFGAETSGSDVVGRQSYDLELLHNTTHGENSAWLYYRYAGLGLPQIGFAASQSYSHEQVFNLTGGAPKYAGDLVERSQLASLQAIFLRPRVRTSSDFSVGAELEKKIYSTNPGALIARVPTFFQRGSTYPSVFVGADWNNVRRPPLSISPEDGLGFSTTLRQRWSNGASLGASRSAVAALTGYKSLDLGAFAHHVIALRAAGGIADDKASNRYSAGGVSGSSLAILGGYDVGGQRRTFGVRGYPAGSEEGIRAASGSVEFRAPLFAPSRGFPFLPLFIDKISALAFADAGRAYCPARAVNGNGACLPSDTGNPWMSSFGAELSFDTGIQLDYAARLRLGVAFPTSRRQQLRAPASLLYATFGASF